MCDSPGKAETAKLVAGLEGLVILAGDLAYMHGSATDFRNCFDPEWGRFRSRWRPVPWNSRIRDAERERIFRVLREAADPDRLGGYYSFMTGDWLVLMLNSNIPAGRGLAQWELRDGNSISSVRRAPWPSGIIRSSLPGQTPGRCTQVLFEAAPWKSS